jgi:hypothetical protein
VIQEDLHPPAFRRAHYQEAAAISIAGTGQLPAALSGAQEAGCEGRRRTSPVDRSMVCESLIYQDGTSCKGRASNPPGYNRRHTFSTRLRSRGLPVRRLSMGGCGRASHKATDNAVRSATSQRLQPVEGGIFAV